MVNNIIIHVKKKFLSNISKNRLRKMEKNEKDPKAKMILLACMAKKEEMKLKDIAQTLNTPYNTVRGWINHVSKVLVHVVPKI